MQGIVAEINGKYAVVLGRDGSFIKVRNAGNLKVGGDIDTDQLRSSGLFYRYRVPSLIKVPTIAAAFIFTLGISYGAYCYSTPYSYIGVDINPSVELTVNRYDRIIRADALNSDGKELLKNNSLGNLKVGDGIGVLLEEAHEKGYLKAGDENAVLLSVASKDDDKSKQLEESLKDAAAEKISEESVKADVVVGKATSTEYNKAKKIGVTPGKLSLMEKAVQADPGLKLEDLKDSSVKAIMKKLEAASKEAGSKKGNAAGDKAQPGDASQQGQAQNTNNTDKTDDQNWNKDNKGKKNDKGREDNGDTVGNKNRTGSGTLEKGKDQGDQAGEKHVRPGRNGGSTVGGHGSPGRKGIGDHKKGGTGNKGGDRNKGDGKSEKQGSGDNGTEN